jgi:hypothetical protein
VSSNLLAERLCAQLLSGPAAGDVLDVVRRLLAVQAQDPRGARLAIRARSEGLLASDVDRELTVNRSLVISSLNRGTLHLVRSDDYWWLHQLTTPQLGAGSDHRLATEKISPAAADRALRVMTDALERNGPLTRTRLKDHLVSADIRLEGMSLLHLVFLAAIRGLLVRGPMIDGEQAFVLVADWLGPAPAPLDREVALGELARRYLAAHGPASDRDLAKWAGITLGDARRGLRRIAAQLIDRDDGLAAVVDRSARAELPPPKLLGAFDPALLGWVSRAEIVDGHQGVVTANGLFRPIAMVNGQAVATWRLDDGQVSLTPLDDIAAEDADALKADAEAVLGFLG